MQDIEGLVRAAGLDGVPLTLAVRGTDDVRLNYVQGRWPSGAAVSPNDRFYAASLSKQITAAAAALLVKDRALDVDALIDSFIRGLPGWGREVTVRMLLHHTGGLPDVASEPVLTGHLTNEWAMGQLRSLDRLPFRPGAGHHYSNLGYICLSEIVATASGEPLAAFVDRRIAVPLDLDGMGFWARESVPPFLQAEMLGHVLPLSVGDGGLWTTASAYLRWLDCQNRDALGIVALTDQPGRLRDGTTIDYGWGLGLRQFRGKPLFIHGGSWRGASAKAVRAPTLGIAVVVLAATDGADRVSALVDSLTTAAADGLTARSA